MYDDPRGWLQNYIKKRPVPNRAAKGTGFIYVLAITGTVSYVKVGSTAGPRARFAALRSEAIAGGYLLAAEHLAKRVPAPDHIPALQRAVDGFIQAAVNVPGALPDTVPQQDTQGPAAPA
ncbi:hypothetical protein ACFYSF_45985 [Streptomyces canus]|uniref:hypothetical protein n=1 Tax=Streptomyces canus TaxID=58343 RepID=UPI0036CE8F25